MPVTSQLALMSMMGIAARTLTTSRYCSSLRLPSSILRLSSGRRANWWTVLRLLWKKGKEKLVQFFGPLSMKKTTTKHKLNNCNRWWTNYMVSKCPFKAGYVCAYWNNKKPVILGKSIIKASFDLLNAIKRFFKLMHILRSHAGAIRWVTEGVEI